MAFESIQIFACDHRKDVKWDLPYVRLGNCQSDAVVNIQNDVEVSPYQLLLSEGAQMWWVHRHYEELGDPDFIGFCHYRRFFSLAINRPLMNISQSQYTSLLCAKPNEILSIIMSNKLDGILFVPLQVTDENEHLFVDIQDQLKFLSKKDKLGISDKVVDIAFELMFNNVYNNDLKQALHNAMKHQKTYVCNIFVMKKDMFKTFASVVFSAFKELRQRLTDEQLNMMHPRFMGYILERFTSMFLYAFQSLGNRFGTLPLLTIDAHIHQKWSPAA